MPQLRQGVVLQRAVRKYQLLELEMPTTSGNAESWSSPMVEMPLFCVILQFCLVCPFVLCYIWFAFVLFYFSVLYGIPLFCVLSGMPLFCVIFIWYAFVFFIFNFNYSICVLECFTLIRFLLRFDPDPYVS